MTEQSRALLRERYIFRGQLVMETALHLGGGREAIIATDSPILRDAGGQPFIPGSSLKGAFRSAVERLAPALGYRTCALLPGTSGCISTDEPLYEAYRLKAAQVGHGLKEEDLLPELETKVCDTCRLFGSNVAASKVRFADLRVVQDSWLGITQVRDGVGINRDTERAEDRIKYDFEVVPPGTAFEFEMVVENPTPTDKVLLAIGLTEFESGMVPMGGIRSRGLGRCRLVAEPIQYWNLTDASTLRAYLIKRDGAQQIPLAQFVQDALAVQGGQ
jgi:CRISPR-associated RAMP protein (TIGR02581 family)